ncbi:TPA: hypothetical protein ACXG57_002875 [Escherichia coli]
MNTEFNKDYFIEAFLGLEKVAYTHSHQGVRTREFLLAFHNNRKVDVFGFVCLDLKLQKYVLYLLQCHINYPHCIGEAFQEKLKNLSRFEDM